MKTVLFVGPDYRNHRGGIGAVLEVYSRNISPFKFIPTYNTGSFDSRVKTYLRACMTLISTLRRDKEIRIVHIHTSARGSFARKAVLVTIAKWFGKKVILHVHASTFHVFYDKAGIGRKLIRYFISKADTVVALSGTWKTYFEKNFPVRHVVIINNVVEPPAALSKPASPNGRVRMLFLGLIGDRKGIFDLLDVLDSHRDTIGQSYELKIGGNGEVERLQSLLQQRHAQDPISYVGWVSGSGKNALLSGCDLYILPSYNEGLPISILEALSYRNAVISTRIGGIPEVVRPGVNGWLFEAGDKAALAAILKEALANRTRVAEFGENSLKISKDYTPESVFRSLELLYQQLN